MEKLSAARLQDLLSEHIDFLAASNAAFDQGYLGEAKRMAVSIRVLVHDTGKSHSLLGQIGDKPAMLDTSFPYDPTNLFAHLGLLVITGNSSRVTFRANGDDFDSELTPFEIWWNATVLREPNQPELSRRDLILRLANKDGGAHVDPSLNHRFERLKTGESIPIRTGPEERAIPDAVAHSVRQISHEVLRTLRR